MKYGIIGSGSANSKVVQDGLLDITDGDEKASFIIHARRAPQGAVSAVYDFLVDNEMPFDAVHRVDDNAPKALLNYAVNVETTEDPIKTTIAMCDEVLLLWDESNEETSEKLAIMCADAGKPIKDLTMALTPIVIEGSPEPVKLVQEPVQEVTESAEVSPFTRDELMNMNIGVLRRQAKSLGVENVGKTKQEIVDAIFYHEPVDDDSPIISADTHVPSEEPVSQMAVIVWHENGAVRSQTVLLNEVKDLLR